MIPYMLVDQARLNPQIGFFELAVIGLKSEIQVIL